MLPIVLGCLSDEAVAYLPRGCSSSAGNKNGPMKMGSVIFLKL